ncbi:Acylphosphatase [Penicillium sp. DV-2018c]|nr:Acylphosphatase [Penicillium sp. DV-2018c]KAJ5583265.1 Acylphosphatase [Penicillium sp. DV-2018c]
MSNIRVAFKVHGTVQGVGFRDFTQKAAKLHELKGWVRNTTCGRVEGEAQGPGENVKKFLQRIDKGPSMAQVVKLEKRNLDLRDDEEGFSVMRTAESMFKPDN